MLSRIKEFVKRYQADIILVIGVILISLLSFAMGYIVARQQEKEPLKIEFRLQNLESRIAKVKEDSFFSIFAFPSDSEGGRRKFTFFALATRKLDV